MPLNSVSSYKPSSNNKTVTFDSIGSTIQYSGISKAAYSERPNSQPEPDIVILQNQDDDYLNSHPTPQDILLLIEIADSSLKYDQQVKLPLYAQAGISDYWIFNLIENCLETYKEPLQDLQGKFNYRRKIIYLPNESVNLPCFPELTLDLSNVFPG